MGGYFHKPRFVSQKAEGSERKEYSCRGRYCWICFSDAENSALEWVQPCNCRGTLKWVHHTCIQIWVAQKFRESGSEQVSCPNCREPYTIVCIQPGAVIVILDLIELTVNNICDRLSNSVLFLFYYWSAITYSAMTLRQILGKEEALSTLQQAGPLLLVVGFPAFPVVLITIKRIKWEDTVLQILRNYSPKIPILKHILPANDCRTGNNLAYGAQTSITIHNRNEHLLSLRTAVGALLLPSIGSVIGSFVFPHVQPNWKRTLMGGAVFLGLEGLLKMYLAQKKFAQKKQRKILNYPHDHCNSRLG